MKLFVDTFNVGVLERAAQTGILSGVTHNPPGMAKEGPIDFVANLKKICAFFDRLGMDGAVVNSELLSQMPGAEDVEKMVEDAVALSSLDKRIHVKVAITGPAGLAAIKRLGAMGIKTNATVVYNVVQALVAAEAGATVVSLFGGPLADSIANSPTAACGRPDLVGQTRTIYDRYGYKTKILNVARHPIDVAESAIQGADYVTMAIDLFMSLATDPWSDSRLVGFMSKWAEVQGSKTWSGTVGAKR